MILIKAKEGYMKDEINYTKLGITIAVAIFVANMGLFVCYKLWTNYEFKLAADALSLSMEESRAASAERLARQKAAAIERNRVMSLKAERAANASRLNRETCAFWKKEYSKTRTSYNKTMMDSSCSR